MNKVAIVTVVLLSVFLGYQFVNKFDPGEILFTSVTSENAENLTAHDFLEHIPKLSL